MTDTEKQARERATKFVGRRWCIETPDEEFLSPNDAIDMLVTYGSSEYERGRKAEIPERWDEDTCKRFEQAPCFLCGYSGEGYFQPDKHSCAQLYHLGQTETVKEAYERGLRDGREAAAKALCELCSQGSQADFYERTGHWYHAIGSGNVPCKAAAIRQISEGGFNGR